ncbi:MAG: TlyA family RNA methyltransferase [Candidatus Ancaeobacter aquaticus]|nr:TlyA family RNA methyltransferase [Candidatus Ancaeobacter aquaticus]
MKIKKRLDQALHERGLVESREKAKRLVIAGKVKVNDCVVDKPSYIISEDDVFAVKESEPFVSRGGFKLQKAVEKFSLSVHDKIALDVGASTGGFTDCLLKNGALKVYSVDVGRGQLAWVLRNDERVIVRENINARYLSEKDVPDKVDIATIDVSFISLKKILPSVKKFLKTNAIVIALIKPQFEADRADAKKGVVKDPAVHKKVNDSIIAFAQDIGFDFQGLTVSPITGPAGNIEFLLYLGLK